MNSRYAAVAQRAGHRCEYCLAPEVMFNLAFEVEHVVPPGQGGSSDFENLALACRSCNLFKSDHIRGIDPDDGGEAPLFHPRRNDWTDHFRFDSTTDLLIGLTPTGRSTIALLRMNGHHHRTARRHWIALGLYP